MLVKSREYNNILSLLICDLLKIVNNNNLIELNYFCFLDYKVLMLKMQILKKIILILIITEESLD